MEILFHSLPLQVCFALPSCIKGSAEGVQRQVFSQRQLCPLSMRHVGGDLALGLLMMVDRKRRADIDHVARQGTRAMASTALTITRGQVARWRHTAKAVLPAQHSSDTPASQHQTRHKTQCTSALALQSREVHSLSSKHSALEPRALKHRIPPSKDSVNKQTVERRKQT